MTLTLTPLNVSHAEICSFEISSMWLLKCLVFPDSLERVKRARALLPFFAVIVDRFACVLRVERIADGDECLALDFVALDLELDRVVVAACGRRNFCCGRDFVRIAEGVCEAGLVQGILPGLIDRG